MRNSVKTKRGLSPFNCLIQGGHNIPEEVIRRRFAHGIANFERYKALVNSWQLYDNSGIPAVLIEEGQSK